MDEREHLICLRDAQTGRLKDKTAEVRKYEWDDGALRVTFQSGRTYPYNRANVAVQTGTPEPVPDGDRLTVRAETWTGAMSITRFGEQTRVTRRNAQGRISHYLYPAKEVDVVADAATQGEAPAVLKYWRALAHSLQADDPTRRALDGFRRNTVQLRWHRCSLVACRVLDGRSRRPSAACRIWCRWVC